MTKHWGEAIQLLYLLNTRRIKNLNVKNETKKIQEKQSRLLAFHVYLLMILSNV